MGRRFTTLNAMALVVGAAAGLAAVIFRYAINGVENLAFSGSLTPQDCMGGFPACIVGTTARESNTYLVATWGVLVVFVPVVGGLLVGMISTFWPETRQYGVTEVMAAVQAKGGILRARSSWGHAAISAITVGTGGSTGREGPIGYIGAALGSSFSRRLKFSPRDIKVLLGCGFSAGIAASFNAPLGAVLMAIELVLPEFSTHSFIPLVGATVVGVTVGHFFLADQATFTLPAFEFNSPWELLIYLVLGIICGYAAVGFIRLVSWTYGAWAAIRIPEVGKPAVGGFLVGIIGLVMFFTLKQYHVFGTGYATISEILNTPASGFIGLLPLLAILVVAKPVATSITVGSGGGGGMFSVSLYQGAIIGGIVGMVAHMLLPGIASSPASYAVVGMGAFYAASSRATLTGIVIITELTRDYSILLPLMLAAVTADAVSVRLSRESLYTIKLSQKGIHYEHDRVQSPLDFMQVKDVMTRDVHTLPATTTAGEAFNRMLDLGHTGYPVVDSEGKLAGIVTRRDLSKHLQSGKGTDALSTIVSGTSITATPDEMLHRARDRIFREGIGRLIVVDPRDRKLVVGIITRSDLLRAEAEKDVEHEDSWSQ